VVREFKERFSERLNSLNLPASLKEQIAQMAVEVLKNLEAEGRLEFPKTAECSPELLSAVEAAVAKVAAELQRELERKMDKVKEEIIANDDENTLNLAKVMGKAGGEIKARIELAKDELREEIKDAKSEIIKEQQDLAYLNSRSW
jgi:gas vesicle protein